MLNQVFITPDGWLEIEVVGSQTAESVVEMGRAIERYCRQLRAADRPVLIIDNLYRMGETTPAARSEVARLARNLDFDRAAMIGGSGAMMRHGTNLMLRAIGRPNVRYFASRDAALLWLGSAHQT